jgi:hypothetical protein
MRVSIARLKKIGYSAFGIALIALAFYGTLDAKGHDYTEQAFNRALITFGVARGINGVISVAQGTEIAIHPAGFGVNFTPGEILDPINDMIEQFSWVMLASTASLGVQRIFLLMSSSWASSAVLTLFVVLAVGLIWQPAALSPQLRKLVKNGVLVMLFIRFSIPLAAIGSEALYEWFLADQYEESTRQLEQTQETISKLNKQSQQEIRENDGESMMDRAKRWFDSAAQNMDVGKRIDEYKEVAADASRHAVNLIVVFVIQTVMLPLLFLWAIYRFLRDIGRKLLA